MKVVSLAAYRRLFEEADEDALANELWDLFEAQADQAWEWRDHESLNDLLDTMGKLRPLLEVKPRYRK